MGKQDDYWYDALMQPAIDYERKKARREKMLKWFSIRKKIIKSYFLFGSTEGEDKILLNLIAMGELPEKGTYLDVGCSTPIKGSNTFLLYVNGWRGLCIDCRKIRRFRLFRPRDYFLQKTITDISEYYGHDLLDLDVDGIEETILRTMKFYPKYILCEKHLKTQEGVPAYLESIGYKLVALTTKNGLWKYEGTTI